MDTQKEFLLLKSLFAVLFIVVSAVSILKPSPVSASTSTPHIVAATQATGCTSWYTVKAGDTLSKLSSNWRAVASYNGIANPNLIYVGQKLCLAWSGSSSASVIPLSYTSKGPNLYPRGQCTWGAYELASRDLNGLGNAGNWDNAARARGLPVGSTPVVGSTVVFEPGVQGANSTYGHVGHVTAIGSSGTFQIEEMNSYGYGGGFGIFSYRWVHTGSGVSFIY